MNKETTILPKKLMENQTKFFNQLNNYLDSNVYFYGSILRPDYFPGKSDIDVDIFTDNEKSTIFKLQHFLNVNKKHFKKIVWRIKNKIIYGYKIFYINNDINIKVEISIYNTKFKEDVINEHSSKAVLPFYILFILSILKFIHYYFFIMDRKTYAYLKKITLSVLIRRDFDQFVKIS